MDFLLVFGIRHSLAVPGVHAQCIFIFPVFAKFTVVLNVQSIRTFRTGISQPLAWCDFIQNDYCTSLVLNHAIGG